MSCRGVGFVVATPPSNSAFRARWSILIAAGPMTDGLILFGGYRVITACYGTIGHSFLEAGGAVAAALFFWVLWTALTGVLPIRGWAAGRRFSTDGYLLLRLWTASNRILSDWASVSDWRKALDLFQSTDGYRNAARNADSSKVERSASLSENSRIFQAQRNRLGSQLLHEPRKESPTA